MGLIVTPIDFAEANAFVSAFHRHHKPMVGCKFCVAVSDAEKVRGVAIVGRPVARRTCQRTVAEVTRCCTDGTRNACSFLYSTAARIARELGFAKIQTFILDSEHGTSLKAAGWTFERETAGGLWCRELRQRDDDAPICAKQLWSRLLGPTPPSAAGGGPHPLTIRGCASTQSAF